MFALILSCRQTFQLKIDYSLLKKATYNSKHCFLHILQLYLQAAKLLIIFFNTCLKNNTIQNYLK